MRWTLATLGVALGCAGRNGPPAAVPDDDRELIGQCFELAGTFFVGDQATNSPIPLAIYLEAPPFEPTAHQSGDSLAPGSRVEVIGLWRYPGPGEGHVFLYGFVVSADPRHDDVYAIDLLEYGAARTTPSAARTAFFRSAKNAPCGASTWTGPRFITLEQQMKRTDPSFQLVRWLRVPR